MSEDTNTQGADASEEVVVPAETEAEVEGEETPAEKVEEVEAEEEVE